MSEQLRHYLELEQRVFEWRQTHPDDTPDEDALLEEMDRVWWLLSEGEKRTIEARDPSERGRGSIRRA